MRRLLSIALLFVPIIAAAQQMRKLQYWPEGGDIVCVNGENRYTRALYGSHDDDRIDTSDRPVFVAYKKRDSRNISFTATLSGKNGGTESAVALDKTTRCEARYSAGRRIYKLNHEGWGTGTLHLTVMALPTQRGGIWKFESEGFSQPIIISARSCDIANQKLNRGGDIGTEKPGSLEASPEKTNFDTLAVQMQPGKALYLMFDGNKFYTESTNANLRQLYAEAEKNCNALANQVRLSTPDPYINTLGGAVVAAADGTWDGETFLHGAIGWRTALPGWRGAYAGDFLGWPDRARKHFLAYAASQLTDVPCTLPHPQQDSTKNLARASRIWGTPMYSNGYICSKPHRTDVMNHYDMNLNYIDELLWHISFDADTAFMRSIFPVIKRHLAWEKLNYDPDNDGLYDAFAAIWASDGLYYNGGSGTHSTAYNYRANLLAARIAELLGEDAEPFRREADLIINALNRTLWMEDAGCWAEYKDRMGLKRLHTSAALWTVYTPIDSRACTPLQAYSATRYVDTHIPHIPVIVNGMDTGLRTLSTTNWLPYCWSTNNVAQAEVMHTALAYFHAGRTDAAFRLMKADLMDEMYLGASPGNIGQVSTYDAATGEKYRDFADNVGITAKTLIEGLYGIQPDALFDRCYIRPGFPTEWDSASIKTPYLEYSFRRENGKDIFDIKQNFKKPLQIIIRQNTGRGEYKDTPLTAALEQHAELATIVPMADDETPLANDSCAAMGNSLDDVREKQCRTVAIDRFFNADISDVFNNEYTSPASSYTTLRIPKNGYGQWCLPMDRAQANDSVFRTLIVKDVYRATLPDSNCIPFRSPAKGQNIVYTSLWDNYPDSITVPLKGRASHAYLLMAGTTNQMQSRIDNAVITVHYTDGTTDTLPLRNPDNWCPIEQDYYYDNYAFRVPEPHPMRVHLMSDKVSRELGKELNLKGAADRRINGGAAQIIDMHLNPDKKLHALTLRTLSNDVVVGLMAVTLQ